MLGFVASEPSIIVHISMGRTGSSNAEEREKENFDVLIGRMSEMDSFASFSFVNIENKNYSTGDVITFIFFV